MENEWIADWSRSQQLVYQSLILVFVVTLKFATIKIKHIMHPFLYSVH